MQNISNYTRDTINEIDHMYIKYKYINYINTIFFIFIIFLSGILLSNIFKINIKEDATKNIIIFSSCLVFTIFIKVMTSRPKRLQYRDTIFNLTIEYYKAVCGCIEDAKIEKISRFDIIIISSVYERCKELEIFSKAQLNDLSCLISDLKYKYYY